MSNEKKQKNNPNLPYYIIIAVATAIIIAVIAFAAIEKNAANTPEPTDKPGNSTSIDKTENNTSTQENIPNNTVTETVDTDFLNQIDKSDAKKVEFTMTDGQKFTMEVYPNVAPITAENFINLVNSGFYNGLTFYRVIEGFMAQGGAYDPINQANDPASSIKGEFASNGVENNLPHKRGVVSMARTSEPNSASSQFFICYDDASHLDGDYAAFGYVIEGMETVDSFLDAGTDAYDMPNKDVIIETAVVVE